MIPEKIKKQDGFCAYCDSLWCTKSRKSRCKLYKKYKSKMGKSIRMQIKQRKIDYD